MDWQFALLLMVGMVILLLAVGVPVALAFLGANFIGAFIFLGGIEGMVTMARSTLSAIALFPLAPIPLFILVGAVLFHTGLALRAVDALDRMITRVPARLSLVAIVGGTFFSALSGSTVANTAILGSTLIPEMRRRNYHYTMTMGPILGTGAIAILIPPSALTVLLGSLAEISIADLLIGGIIPGLLIATLFFGYVIVRCLIQPHLAPSYDIERRSLSERFVPFFIYVVPLLAIFVVVVGSILGGIATPSEAAALGSIASILAALFYGKLTWANLKTSLLETAKVSVMVLFIIAGSVSFSQVLAFSGATGGILKLVTGWQLSPLEFILVVLAVLLVLGCFIDQLSMIMITLPFVMPVAKQMGVDLVWFGILMLLMLEISFTTPPFGMLLFVMKGVAPEGTTTRQIYASATPFILLVLVAVILVVFVPDIATWLPQEVAVRR